MNIFNALSARADSKLREPNLSAVLAYFLHPGKDHGLGDTFLKAFLEIIGVVDETRLREARFAKTKVYPEEPIKDEKRTIYLDIVIEVVNSQGDLLRYITVENKIKSSAANTKQLNRYYNALIKDKDNDNRKNKITMVFLTPEPKTKKLKEEYCGLKQLPETAENPDIDNKKWLHWTGTESIHTMIRNDILKKEAEGEISPINEYTKHTLKAFVMHLQKPTDLGDVRESIHYIDDHKYTIERYTSGAIRVYKDGKECIAKKILRHINDKENFGLIDSNNRNKKNTYQLGEQIIKKLKKKCSNRTVNTKSARCVR